MGVKMRHGFIKAAAVTPKIRVADTEYNAKVICERMDEAAERGAKIIVFPELCITGYTCGDLFLQEHLLNEAKKQLLTVVKHSEGNDALIFVGLPLERENKIYNVAAVIQDGEVLAFIPKTYIPNHGEFYEGRYFTKGNSEPVPFWFDGEEVPFGTNILLEADAVDGLTVACEICEDLWAANPPSTSHARRSHRHCESVGFR